MYANNFEQVSSFLIFTIVGIVISIIFDIFRILRKTIKTTDIVTYIEDTFFWLITGFIMLYSIFKFNNGELRLYIFIGISIGITLYMLFVSRYFIKINIFIINIIKNIIKRFISLTIIPFKFIFNIIRKIIFKPISFVFINIKGFMTKLLKNFKKIKILNKKSNKNEGIYKKL